MRPKKQSMKRCVCMLFRSSKYSKPDTDFLFEPSTRGAASSNYVSTQRWLRTSFIFSFLLLLLMLFVNFLFLNCHQMCVNKFFGLFNWSFGQRTFVHFTHIHEVKTVCVRGVQLYSFVCNCVWNDGQKGDQLINVCSCNLHTHIIGSMMTKVQRTAISYTQKKWNVLPTIGMGDCRVCANDRCAPQNFSHVVGHMVYLSHIL